MLVEFDERDIALMRYSLLASKEQKERELLAMTEFLNGNAAPTELPPLLQSLTRESISEQIDPWKSLVDHYAYLIRELDKASE